MKNITWNKVCLLYTSREYPALLKERRRVFNTYSKAFADYDWAIIPPSVDGEKESAYHIYALIIKNFTE